MCLLKAIIAWPPRAAVRSSDMWATRDCMPKRTHYSHGHFPWSVFECPVGGFTSLLAFCPSLSWIACGRSQTKEKSVMDSLDSPLERPIVSLSSQKSRCLEPWVTRFGSAWNLMVSLPAPCSFPQRLSGLHNFVSTEKWRCPKGQWKSRTKLWTSSEAAGCGTLYRGSGCGPLQALCDFMNLRGRGQA